MRWLGWYVGVPVAALVGGVCGTWSLLVLGLSWALAVPVSIFFGVLYAALCATWMGNLTASDETRGRLALVLVVSATSGLLASIAVVAAASSLMLPLSLIEMLGSIFAVVAMATSVAVWRFRGPRGRLGWRGATVLALAGVWAVTLFLVSPGVEWGLGLREAMFGSYRAAGYGGTIEWAVAAGLVVAVSGIVWVAWQTFRGISGHGVERDAVVTLVLVALSMPVFILVLRLFPAEGP